MLYFFTEFDVIVNVVARFPDGVPLSKIMESLSIPISRRNVQHRLVFLVKNGLLHAEGRARGRLYKLPAGGKKDAQVSNAYTIPLSPEAEYIQKQVSQPIQARTPVGYNIKFLDKFLPSKIFFIKT